MHPHICGDYHFRRDIFNTYDKIGRIVREDNRKFGKTTLWTYDNCGNILSQCEARYTLKATDEITEFESEKLYYYDGDKLLSFGNEILFYTDEEGKDNANPLIYRGQQLTWNYGRQLVKFGVNTFEYDGYGRRIKKNNTVFSYDANNNIIKQFDGTNTLEFIYDNGGLSGVTYNGTEYIYCKDIQGNIVAILDNKGREVVQYVYSAWGKVKTIVIDEAHKEIAELNPFRYRSYYLDIETNLYYLQTRYYDPEVGRFISQDDVSYLDPKHINGLNLYVYSRNNPVMYVDYHGTEGVALTVILVIVGIIVGTLMGGVTGGLSEEAGGGNFLDGFWGGIVNGFLSTVGVALGIAMGGPWGLVISFVFGFVGGIVGGIVTEASKTGGNISYDYWEGEFLTKVLPDALMNGAASVLSGLLGVQMGAGAGSSFLARFLDALKFEAFSFVSPLAVGFPMMAITIVLNAVINQKKKERAYA